MASLAETGRTVPIDLIPGKRGDRFRRPACRIFRLLDPDRSDRSGM